MLDTAVAGIDRIRFDFAGAMRSIAACMRERAGADAILTGGPVGFVKSAR